MSNLREKLVDYYFKNPCLSEPIDYEVDEVRLEYYKDMVKHLSDEEVYEQYQEIKETVE